MTHPRYTATVLFRDVTVMVETQTDGSVTYRFAGDMGLDEVAGLKCIGEVLRCLSNGRPLEPYFNPTVDHAEMDRIVKCKWERSGNLTIMGPTDRCHLHADNVKDAVSRARVFTTTMAVAKQLPAKRG